MDHLAGIRGLTMHGFCHVYGVSVILPVCLSYLSNERLYCSFIKKYNWFPAISGRVLFYLTSGSDFLRLINNCFILFINFQYCVVNYVLPPVILKINGPITASLQYLLGK